MSPTKQGKTTGNRNGASNAQVICVFFGGKKKKKKQNREKKKCAYLALVVVSPLQ